MVGAMNFSASWRWSSLVIGSALGLRGSCVLPLLITPACLAQVNLALSCELEVLGGMEKNWHENCSVMIRTGVDKRIRNDG